MPTDTLVIINGEARNGDQELREALKNLEFSGWQLQVERPENPADIPHLIREWGPTVQRIIIGSGDGTLNRAAKALIEVNKPLGILPLGTANDLANTLCIPTDLSAACQTIQAGRLQRIDLGIANGVYFFNVASLGLSEHLTQRLTSEGKRTWGVLAYIWRFIESYYKYPRFQVFLTCQGHRESFKSIQLAVGNGRYYGGGMAITEEAKIDDQKLNLVSLKPQSLWAIARMALPLRMGRVHDKERVIHRSGQEMEVRTSSPIQVDTDGELTTETPVHFRIMPGALSFYVGKDYQPRRNADAAR